MALQLTFLSLSDKNVDTFPVWASLHIDASYQPEGFQFTADWTFTSSGGPAALEISNTVKTGGFEFWEGDWTFQLFPFRCPELDSCVVPAENIGSAFANMQLTNFDGNIERLNISVEPGEDAPAIDPAADSSFQNSNRSTDGNLYWQTSLAYFTAPPALGLTLALFGCRTDGSAWELIPLGPGDDYSYTAVNPFSGEQNVVLDVTAFCKSYLLNKNNYSRLAWTTVPSTAVNLVSEVNPSDADAIAAAIWAMLARGSLSFTHYGFLEGHDGDPAFSLDLASGEVTTMSFQYNSAVIQPMCAQLTGDLALPDGCRISPYGVAMGPLS